MNTFVQHDERNKVTAVFYSEDSTMLDFIKLDDSLPKPEKENDVLMFDPDNHICYFKPPGLNDSERIEQLEKENIDLKSSVAMLEDIVMMLTTSQL
ncbi:hypothetical protein [Exiguobacterium sp. s138]|uniref:hypothetical protein n=1 Tax=unclassified Exiguobacterium TaxID=2644629 RepID=UPI001BE6B84B|nr:hypothetical protein [Exiguobacterium sp. s138]